MAQEHRLLQPAQFALLRALMGPRGRGRSTLHRRGEATHPKGSAIRAQVLRETTGRVSEEVRHDEDTHMDILGRRMMRHALGRTIATREVRVLPRPQCNFADNRFNHYDNE